MYENIIAIHNILKKKNYIVKFLTSSIFKKISKDNFETKFFLKKKQKKEEEINFGLKKKQKKTCKKKTCCYREYPTSFRVLYNNNNNNNNNS
jgi:hypothetical protein